MIKVSEPGLVEGDYIMIIDLQSNFNEIIALITEKIDDNTYIVSIQMEDSNNPFFYGAQESNEIEFEMDLRSMVVRVSDNIDLQGHSLWDEENE